MADTTKIGWCDSTFNPWIGCAKIAPECKFCYAEELMDKRYKKVVWGVNGTRVRTSAANWKKPIQWNAAAEKSGKRHLVFCASLADVFEDFGDTPAWRSDLLDLIENTPALTWLLLTKRPENAGFELFGREVNNIWLGSTTGTQEAVELKTLSRYAMPPIPVLFASMEPLLEPVRYHGGLDWVIVGGESGRDARKTELAWIEQVVADCRKHRTPVFVKQLGSKLAKELGVPGKGEDIDLWPESIKHLAIREFPAVIPGQ